MGLSAPTALIAALPRVFLDGLRRASRLQLLAPLYLAGLVLGLVQTWPLVLAGGNALRNPFLGRLAGGGTDVLVDLFIARPGTIGNAAAWGGALVPLTLIYGLLYNFFAGGILSAFAGTRPFWAGCRRTFWSFTGLGTLLPALALVLVLPIALLGGFPNMWTRLIVIGVLLQLLNILGEYARVIAVVQDRRNPFALLSLSARFCARNMLGVLALALLGLLLHLALAALYLALAVSFGASPLVVIWQQLVALGWVWIKLLRLAWAVSFVGADDW